MMTGKMAEERKSVVMENVPQFAQGEIWFFDAEEACARDGMPRMLRFRTTSDSQEQIPWQQSTRYI